MLLSILVRNDGLRPNRSLAPVAQERKLVRVPLPCSLRSAQMAIARRRARAQRMSVNAYLEALISAQLARPAANLVILFAKP